MSNTFTDTELVIISLVLSQQREQYDDIEMQRQITEISTKAREAASDA